MSTVTDVILILERLHKNISITRIDQKDKQHMCELVDLAISKLTEVQDDNTKKSH
jgi:hypothetical protein